MNTFSGVNTSTTVVGHLEHDPTASRPQGGRWPTDQDTGRPVVRTAFGVIVTRRWQNPTSLKFHEKSSRFTVFCEGYVAQNVIDGLRKGDRVVVTGHMEQIRGDLVLFADDVGLALSKHQVNPEEIPT